MGLLEIFDNPNLIQSLIGGGFSTSGPAQMPEMAPPDAMSQPGSEMLAQAQPRFGGDMSPQAAWGPQPNLPEPDMPPPSGLSGTLGASAVPGAPMPTPRPIGIDPMGAPGPQMQPPLGGVLGPGAIPPGVSQLDVGPPAPPRTLGPGAVPAGVSQLGGAPGMPPASSPSAPVPRPRPDMPAAPSAPMALSPASSPEDIVRSYRAAGGGQDVSGSVPGGGGGQGLLARTIGMSADKEQALMSSLGAGLKAAGNSAGKSPGQAFASGMGAGMEGGSQETDKQRKRKMEEANQKFNQSSTAFKDMIASQQADNMAEYRKNQAKYLSARADALNSGAMGRSGAAWKGTPHDLINTIESDGIKMRDQFRKTAETNAKQTGEAVDDAAIDAKVKAWKEQRYKGMGMTPAQAEQIKTMGTQPPKLPDGKPNPAFNPFTGLSEDQIKTLPDGAYFLHNGKVFKRDYKKKPPPGAASQAAAEPNLDDQEAMAG